MNLTAWHDFFLATAGAAAGLTGLLFVGVSINITKILSFAKLPDRALLSLLLLLNILIVSSLMLIPVQSGTMIGIELTIMAVVIYTVVTMIDLGIYRHTVAEYKKQYFLTMLFNQLSIFPYLIGALIVLSGNEHGLYWIVPGILLSFIKAVVDAWVLLVEINR